ncbi:MAG: bifunctional phosphoribosylaminoimidazolecarboxamide formyltransferase/IMP cyclohydrolase [Ignavibacterium sp.]|nr:bifunctional phosphoribosylaminoimidazolecarboxamide formyltransferase/IMP cyclohydrolase [Ignavibacterium sp.]MDW8376386.1 bifunctional phosphoribosylaminoimidazolecarboxamide formyltransferase/IMP cyclohydrolase [Ignavibacteriales bacterium]
MKYSLISVSDKSNIVEFAKALIKFDYNIIATGKTSKLLTENNIPNKEISDFTGFREILKGRVKTLHPKVFGGILMKRDEADFSEAKSFDIFPIDIVCVNLYPFKEIIKNDSASIDEVIENIDIGGPSLIRAAAKNYKHVSVLTSPEQYQEFIERLEKNLVDEEYRIKLAYRAFSYTADFDISVSNYFERKFELEKTHLKIFERNTTKLRYGENPHQKAEIYGDFFLYFNILHGKEISYNNILDIISGVELSEELNSSACVIIKHNNPCGVASLDNNYNSYIQALKSDPISAFGGIVVFGEEVDDKLAEKLNEIFLEVIVAPDFSPKALEILKKKKDRRIVKKLKNINEKGLDIRSIPGGFLVQERDLTTLNVSNIKIVTENKPSSREMYDLIFAWIVAKHVKSNAIVIAKNKVTLGIGAGQTSRLDSVKIAINKAKELGFDLSNSVVGSDAFFPFPDGVIKLAEAGVSSIIQPGGSIRDEEVIQAANKYKLSMLFTGIRHFKH